MSDGQQDNSLFLLVEKEWMEAQQCSNKPNCNLEISHNQIEIIMDDAEEESDEFHKLDRNAFIRTQKIELHKEERVNDENVYDENLSNGNCQ